MGKLREIIHLVKELRRHMITLGNYKSDERKAGYLTATAT